MKKTITTFLLVAFIISFVVIGVGILTAVLSFVHEDGLHVSDFVQSLFTISFGVFDLVVMIYVRNQWANVKAKEDAKKIAILSIVAGALVCVFSAVAGILMLTMPADQYKEDK